MKAVGFGFFPEESQHHFLVEHQKNSSIIIYERFRWQEAKLQKIDMEEDTIKAEISTEKWGGIKEEVQKEFNTRLKKKKIASGKFVIGHTPLNLLFGKELLVLVWAMEEVEEEKEIKNAIRNWLGLSPEERWWLYTVTNATTGGRDDRRGWRKALRYALCEN